MGLFSNAGKLIYGYRSRFYAERGILITLLEASRLTEAAFRRGFVHGYVTGSEGNPVVDLNRWNDEPLGVCVCPETGEFLQSSFDRLKLEHPGLVAPERFN